MKKSRKREDFIEKPTYPGGIRAMKEFIAQHLKYPEEALSKKIEGSVFLKYDINERGTVYRVRVIQRLGYGCDEEAERVVRLFKFVVHKRKGMKIKFTKDIRIHFRLPKQEPHQSGIQLTYTITKEKKGGYGYEVDLG